MRFLIYWMDIIIKLLVMKQFVFLMFCEVYGVIIYLNSYLYLKMNVFWLGDLFKVIEKINL